MVLQYIYLNVYFGSLPCLGQSRVDPAERPPRLQHTPYTVVPVFDLARTYMRTSGQKKKM